MTASRSIYDAVYARAQRDPEAFWAAAAEDLVWERRWDRVLDDSRPPFVRWFTGGALNTCENAIDVHIDRGRGKQRALVYDSPVTGTVQTWTYIELRDAVATMAGALRRAGIEKGDRVIIYMPMVPEAVFAMLACARIGAIHSVVFGGFAANELAKRIVRLANARSELVFRPLPEDDPRQRQPDITRARTVLGWEPRVDVDDGLRMTIEWYRRRLGG